MDEVLSGGVANAGKVVRRGDEVLRPVQPNEADIHRLLLAVREAGFDGVPRALGLTDDGRSRYEHIPGDVVEPPYPPWVQTNTALASIARLLRRFHDAVRDCAIEGT